MAKLRGMLGGTTRKKLSSSKNMYELKAVIDRFEGNKVVIKTQNGQEILWPRENLPQETKEGSWIKLVLKTSASDKEEREKLAKTLLNEILNNRSQ